MIRIILKCQTLTASVDFREPSENVMRSAQNHSVENLLVNFIIAPFLKKNINFVTIEF